MMQGLPGPAGTFPMDVRKLSAFSYRNVCMTVYGRGLETSLQLPAVPANGGGSQAGSCLSDRDICPACTGAPVGLQLGVRFRRDGFSILTPRLMDDISDQLRFINRKRDQWFEGLLQGILGSRLHIIEHLVVSPPAKPVFARLTVALGTLHKIKQRVRIDNLAGHFGLVLRERELESLRAPAATVTIPSSARATIPDPRGSPTIQSHAQDA